MFNLHCPNVPKLMETGFEVMVEVFRTNVERGAIAQQLLQDLVIKFPAHRINFDLDDCDRILRFEGPPLSSSIVEAALSDAGFQCRALEA